MQRRSQALTLGQHLREHVRYPVFFTLGISLFLGLLGSLLAPYLLSISYGQYFAAVYLWPGPAVIFALMGLMCLLEYADECGRKSNQYYLADLPWRRGWPAVYAVLLGPIGWVSLAVSAVHLARGWQPKPDFGRWANGGQTLPYHELPQEPRL
jgi:hypothetical protein